MKNCKYLIKEMMCQNGTNRIYGLAYIPQLGLNNFPAVILSHGYNSSHRDVRDIAEKIAENGMVAYCYDFCGGSSVSKSDGKSTDMSILTEQEDLTAVIKMLQSKDFIESSRIYLYGESQGGFVSALTAVQMKEDIAGMLLLYPAFCIPDHWPRSSHNDMPEVFEFMGMKLSRAFLNGLPEYDVFSYVSGFNRPVLIFHGDADRLVDLSYSERVRDALPDCTLEIYENEGHGFSAGARRDISDKIIEFLEKHALEKV